MHKINAFLVRIQNERIGKNSSVYVLSEYFRMFLCHFCYVAISGTFQITIFIFSISKPFEIDFVGVMKVYCETPWEDGFLLFSNLWMELIYSTLWQKKGGSGFQETILVTEHLEWKIEGQFWPISPWEWNFFFFICTGSNVLH